MAEQHDKQRGAITLWLIVLITLIVAAALLGFWTFRNVNIRIVITNQPAKVTIQEPVRISAQVRNKLDIRLDTTLQTKVPIDTMVSIPLNDTLSLQAVFDTRIPLALTVEVHDTIPVHQTVYVEGVVEAEVMGVNLKLPIHGDVGLRAQIPINLVIPVKQKVRLNFTAPVKARIREKLTVPLDTTIKTHIPISTNVTVPVKTGSRHAWISGISRWKFASTIPISRSSWTRYNWGLMTLPNKRPRPNRQRKIRPITITLARQHQRAEPLPAGC